MIIIGIKHALSWLDRRNSMEHFFIYMYFRPIVKIHMLNKLNNSDIYLLQVPT